MHGNSRYSRPHWARDTRTRKGLAHLIVNGRTVCTDRKARRADYVSPADYPTMPACETCFGAWIERRNAARLRGEHVPPRGPGSERPGS